MSALELFHYNNVFFTGQILFVHSTKISFFIYYVISTFSRHWGCSREQDKVVVFREHTSIGEMDGLDFSLVQTRDGFLGPGQRKTGFGKPRTDLRASESSDDMEPELRRV